MIILSKIKDWFSQTFDNKILNQRLLWGILFFIILSLILTLDLIPNRVDIKSGEVSQEDITASKTITFIDQEKTQELQEMAVESVGNVYDEDVSVNKNIIEEIKRLFSVIIEKKEFIYSPSNNNKESENRNNQIDNVIDEINAKENINLSYQTLKTLLNTDKNLLQQMRDDSIEIMDRQLQNLIFPKDLAEVKNELEQDVMILDIDRAQRLALAEILKNKVKANMIINEKATEKKINEAIDQVKPYKQTVRQGEIIVRKGDVVTEEDIKILEELGLKKQTFNYLNIIGMILIVLLLLFLIAFYVYKYENDIWNNNKKLLLIELLIIILILIAKIINIFHSSYLYYLIPIAVVPILITVLINKDIALIITIFVSLLTALIFNNPLPLILMGFISGIVGVFSVSRVTQRSDLVRAGFYVSAVLAVLIASITMLNPINNWRDLAQPVGMGILNGVLVAILANGLLPYIENFFGFTSSVKLLELANPSHKLLKRLLVEAPGTYHHSVIVGNLAETAADNVGADSLLTRVAAYYHDIGKLKRPYFFIDNQFGGDNPHDNISANLSSLIIKSHVKDGVELAKKYKLPQPIIDIIKQHHGTNLISFFYQQAMKEDSKNDIIKETDFSYDGPKPQTKEAAIIMLADIVEAALRSKQFNKSDHNRIEGMVKELIKGRLIENQLDQSELTMKDLDIIGDSFVKVLMGIYHQRVDYPENLLKEMKDDNNDRSTN